jgi:hypothetical protein
MAEIPDQRGPYAGYDSLEAAINGLRRARFRVARSFHLPGRGLVVEGQITEGTVVAGMVLIAPLLAHDNLDASLSIDAIEHVLHPGGLENVGLVVQTPPTPVKLSDGMVLDVLQQAPAA